MASQGITQHYKMSEEFCSECTSALIEGTVSIIKFCHNFAGIKRFISLENLIERVNWW